MVEPAQWIRFWQLAHDQSSAALQCALLFEADSVLSFSESESGGGHRHHAKRTKMRCGNQCSGSWNIDVFRIGGTESL